MFAECHLKVKFKLAVLNDMFECFDLYSIEQDVTSHPVSNTNGLHNCIFSKPVRMLDCVLPGHDLGNLRSGRCPVQCHPYIHPNGSNIEGGKGKISTRKA